MDSITQVVLGAACGEAVLGKKVGNRAMFYGAVAGTIPDLDILAYLVADDMTALAFHRGFTHSITFAILAPMVFGYLIHKLYDSGLYKQQNYKRTMTAFWSLSMIGLALLFTVVVPNMIGVGVKPLAVGLGLSIVAGGIFCLWKYYLNAKLDEVNVSRKDWMWLFFWAILTHPLLDSCTAYGTQLFQPFWDYRVAFNNISVVDPIYTLPFLLCLLIAGFLTRNSPKRRFFNYLGIGLSSAYLLFTVYHKFKVDAIFEKSLAAQNINYNRYSASPTIFNNILWQGIAETDSAYYHGMYSFNDKEPRILNFVEIPKNHHLIEQYADERAIKILKWFSNGYYNITIRDDGKLQLNDLRYGSRNGNFDDPSKFVFKFILEEKDGVLTAEESRGPADGRDFEAFFKRIEGL